MVVISDTSPISYLILIGRVDVLPALYRTVQIPSGVLAELRAAGAPSAISRWAAALPSWIETVDSVPGIDAVPTGLGRGEREAIALAEVQPEHSLVLLDDNEARQEAARRHLRITGTLGILRDGAEEGLLDLADAFERLRRTAFRAAPNLYEAVLSAYRRKSADRP